MRWIAAVFIGATFLTGCISNSYKTVVVNATPRTVSNIAGRMFVNLTLTDGSKLEMRPPRDFGDAWCGERGCARKSEIATIEYVETTPDVGSSLLALTVGVPAVALVTGVLCVKGELGCFSSSQGKSLPPATPQQLSRAWLDSLDIVDGRYLGRRDFGNPCKWAYGDDRPRDYANDAEALDAIWNNRHRESSSCLWEASEGFRAMGAASRDRAMRLWALHEVKRRWDSQRCLPTKGKWSGITEPIGPSDDYDLGTGKGDPVLLRIIEETLADPLSYIDNAQLSICSSGSRPEEEWPTIASQVKTLGPFGRELATPRFPSPS